jgi:hypothetical protein
MRGADPSEEPTQQATCPTEALWHQIAAEERSSLVARSELLLQEALDVA